MSWNLANTLSSTCPLSAILFAKNRVISFSDSWSRNIMSLWNEDCPSAIHNAQTKDFLSYMLDTTWVVWCSQGFTTNIPFFIMVDWNCCIISFSSLQHLRDIMHGFYNLGLFLAVTSSAMRLLLSFTFTLALRISPSWSLKCGASQREAALSNPVMSSLAVCYPDLFRGLELAFTMPFSKHI